MKRFYILYYGFFTCLLYALVLSIPLSILLAEDERHYINFPILFILVLQLFLKLPSLKEVTDKSLISKLEIVFFILLLILSITMAFLFNFSTKLAQNNAISNSLAGLTGSVSFISAVTLLIWVVSGLTSTKYHDTKNRIL